MSRANESLESVPVFLWDMLTSDEQMLFVLADQVSEGSLAPDEIQKRLQLMRNARRIKEGIPWYRKFFGLGEDPEPPGYMASPPGEEVSNQESERS